MEDQTRARTPDVQQRHVSSSRSSRRNRRRRGVGASASAGLWQSRHRRGWCLQQGAPLLPSSIHLLLTQTWVQVPGLFPPGEEVKLSSVEADLLTPPVPHPLPPSGEHPHVPMEVEWQFCCFFIFLFFFLTSLFIIDHTRYWAKVLGTCDLWRPPVSVFFF